MLDFIQELSTPHVRDFFLLFLRVSGVLSFFPFLKTIWCHYRYVGL